MSKQSEMVGFDVKGPAPPSNWWSIRLRNPLSSDDFSQSFAAILVCGFAQTAETPESSQVCARSPSRDGSPEGAAGGVSPSWVLQWV